MRPMSASVSGKGTNPYACTFRIRRGDESVAHGDINGITGFPGNLTPDARTIELYKSEVSDDDGAASPPPGSSSNRICGSLTTCPSFSNSVPAISPGNRRIFNT